MWGNTGQFRMVVGCVSSKPRTRTWGASHLQAEAGPGGGGDLLVLGDERHLHVLAGRGHQLPPLRCRRRSLLLIPAHADQEEEARDDQGNGDARDQDVQNPHPAAVLGTCGQPGPRVLRNHPPPSSEFPPAHSRPPLQDSSTRGRCHELHGGEGACRALEWVTHPCTLGRRYPKLPQGLKREYTAQKSRECQGSCSSNCARSWDEK